MAGKVSYLFLAALFGMATLHGCGKEVELLKQQQDALLSKVTQLESRLNTVESQLSQQAAGLAVLHAQITQLEKQRAAKKAPASKKSAKKKKK